MKKKFIFLFICIASNLFSFSILKNNSEFIIYKNKKYHEGDKITIEGTLAFVGNSPFQKLVISDSDGERFIIPKEFYIEFQDRMEQTLLIKGKLKLVILKRIKDDGKVVLKNILPKKIEEIKDE